MNNKYDVVVVGGGHAGVEAAHAVYRNGLSCALVSFSYKTIGQMSCNPAIGGLGKSHLVREVDAMGGIMAQATDISGIQYRTLNTRKGNAVQALRVQCDRELYKKGIQDILKKTDIDIIEGEVVDLISNQNIVSGVLLSDNREIIGKKTILTTGTFLNGIMYTGQDKIQGGRVGEEASIPLSKKLYNLKLPMGRLKTGTPARIKMSSLDLSVMEEQKGEMPTPWMAISKQPTEHKKQLPCYITRTNKTTHKIIQKNIHLSAMYSGNISGIGPRYCPSIEDKVFKFESKDSHQIFIEPEGINKDLVYPNGISTSLPKTAQEDFIYSILGMENSLIEEYGYAVEYDFIDPRSIKPSMETKFFKNFYLAGQINGTTGYEEAAAQGLMAGANAANSIKQKEPLILERSEAYIGVLIDDLTTHGVTEPYRMFTSRAEHRLMLSQNNAEQRLLKIAQRADLVSTKRADNFDAKEKIYQKYLETKILNKKIKTYTNLDNEQVELKEKTSIGTVLKRTDVSKENIIKISETKNSELHLLNRAMVEIKYSGYIDKQKREVAKNKKQNLKEIPLNMKYSSITGLSNEVKEKLNKSLPTTIGAAARIEGVTPAAINLILVHIKKAELQSLNA
ncbi:tRNA uridine-5-carboxymethylaminomethyl(34) synthesis enzyme MnmG [Gammaproteobacteria bacterium]|nr:tRNA uridine-5-carboxymethylaminomethyl(34) synthesis enzyme MnmG [Gammaproteobacteria bacterium]